MRKMALLVAAGVFAALPAAAVPVKYLGEVDLGAYSCKETPESSFVRTICWAGREPGVVVNLAGTWYGYCGVPGSIVQAWLRAPSKGGFYNGNIKGRFGCR